MLKLRLRSCFAVLFFALGLAQSGPERPYVVLVSFDGFRADYLDWYDTPNFDALAAEGVKAKGLQPIFVTKTFPNHYALATGMYAEHHGLIANYFYDDSLEAVYRLSDRSVVEDARFYGGEPIWITAEKQGVRSASYFWVGTEAPIQGRHPTIWKRYDHHFPFAARIDSVAAWLQLPEERRPHLVLLYFHEPDETGHRFGPRAPETGLVVQRMDSLLGVLRERLAALPVYPRLNLIVVSDHGMAAVPPGRTINLADYVDLSGVIQEGSGPTAFLYGNRPGKLDTLYRELQAVPHLTVYRKSEIPDRLHYRDHYRIKDLLLVAEEGWLIGDPQRPFTDVRGFHGYDNLLWSMHGIFLADGPAFKDGYERTVLENIHVYPLIAFILGLEPNPASDGRLEAVLDLLSRH
jgi:alkaline phosphatase D